MSPFAAWTELAWPNVGWVLLINALLATLLACIAAMAERRKGAASLVHGLWVLVLLRFLAPPLVPWEILPGAGLIPERPAATSTAVGPPSGQVPPSSPVFPPHQAPPFPALSPSSEPIGEIPQAAAALDTSVSASGIPWLVEEATKVEGGAAMGWFAEYRTHGGPALLMLLWMSVSFLLLGLALRRVLFFVRLAQDAVAQGHPEATGIQEQAEALAAQLGLPRAPRVCLVQSPDLASPMILSVWGRPKLLLPVALLEALQAKELQTVLVHELAHVRRRDHWVRWPELLAVVLFWWHPVVWWARKSLRRVEEQCVDARVLQLLPQSRRAYAEALLKTMTLRSATSFRAPALASGIDTMNEMESRLTMILKYRPEPTSSRLNSDHRTLRWLALPVLITALAVLPTWARPGEGAPTHGPGETEHEHAEAHHEHYETPAELQHEHAEAHHEHSEAAHEHATLQDRLRDVQSERQELEARSRRQASRQQEAKAEAQRQMAMMERQVAELQAEKAQQTKEEQAEIAAHQERLRQEMVRMESHLKLRDKHFEQDAREMEAHRLALEAEAARLDGDEARFQELMARHDSAAKELHSRAAVLLAEEEALQQARIAEELERLQEHRQELIAAGEDKEQKRLDHHIARLRQEQQRASAAKELRRAQLALEAERRELEAALQAAHAASEQGLRSGDGQRQEEAMAELERRQRQLEKKHRQFEEQQIRAEVRMRLDEIRSDLPLQLEELRMALEEAGDDGELRAELERLHQALGQALDQ